MEGRDCIRLPSGKDVVLLINVCAGCRRHGNETHGGRPLVSWILTIWPLDTTSNKLKIE